MPATDLKDFEEFLASPPPRQVSKDMRKLACKGDSFGVVFGFGLFFFVFSLPFMWGFFPWQIPSMLKLDFGHTETVPGRVTACEKTSSEVNDTPVYLVRFSFTPKTSALPSELPDAEAPAESPNSPAAQAGSVAPARKDTPEKTRVASPQIAGECYFTGRQFQPDESVEVEYLVSSPGLCVVKGGSLEAFGYGGAFVIVFPLVGSALMSFPWRSRQGKFRLLRDGALAAGRVVVVKDTKAEINHRRLYKVEVEFSTGNETRSGSCRLFDGTQRLLAERKRESGETVGVLYLPERPGKVLVLDFLLEA